MKAVILQLLSVENEIIFFFPSEARRFRYPHISARHRLHLHIFVSVSPPNH